MHADGSHSYFGGLDRLAGLWFGHGSCDHLVFEAVMIRLVTLLSIILGFGLRAASVFAVADSKRGHDGPEHLNCILILKAFISERPWEGEPSLVLIPPSGESVKVAPVKSVDDSQAGTHFQLMYYDGRFWYPPQFVAVHQSARQEGKSGFAYRMISYSVFDPRKIEERFGVLADSKQQTMEDLRMQLVPKDEEQAQSSIEMGLSLAILIPSRVSQKLIMAKMPVYGLASADQAASLSLVQTGMLSRYVEEPKKMSLDQLMDHYQATDEQMKSISSSVQRFRGLHSTAESRRGAFGEFSENWYVTRGELDRGIGAGKVEVISHVIQVGPMFYAYHFSVETSSPISELVNSIPQGP